GDTRGVTDITHRRLRASEAVVDLALPLAQVLVDPVAGRDAARGRQGNEHERHAPCHDSSHCESSCPGVDVSNGPWIGAKGATPEPDRKRRFPRARCRVRGVGRVTRVTALTADAPGAWEEKFFHGTVCTLTRRRCAFRACRSRPGRCP